MIDSAEYKIPIDKEVCDEIIAFVKANGPIIGCTIMTLESKLKLNVLLDRNCNRKIEKKLNIMKNI